MTHSRFRGLCVCIAAMSLVSCQDEDFGYTTSEIKSAKYAKDFRNFFGDIDPEQDWNIATRGTVTVTAAPGSEIKVYAKMDGTYKIVGDYENFSGNETLNFDMLEETTDILVTNGTQSAFAKVGESVNLSGTRAGAYGTTGSVTVSQITDPDQWFVFDRTEAEKYQTKLPEGVNNLGKVTQNFTFISNGEFTVYPIFWDTRNTDEIGVYYTDASGYHEVPVYTIKSGDELQYQSIGGHNYYGVTSDLNVGSECPNHSGHKIIHMNHVSSDYAWIYCEDNIKGNFSDIPSQPSTGKFTSDLADTWNEIVKYYISKGVKVNIPTGTMFGMYVKPSDGTKQYSQQEKNSSIYSTAPTKDVYAATFTLPSTENPGTDDMYLCFEDWQTSSSDKDLNDVVFRFYGSTPTVVDEDAQEWVICGEDLGGTFDLDYNDVVVSIAYVSGKTTADFTALAAGGTLASYVYFNGTCLGEIHELLGAQNANSGNYDPINVSGSVGRTAQRTLTVASNFSIATVEGAMDANMGGFQIRVVPAGQASNEDNAVGGQVIQNKWVNTNQNVPYVFCVPRTWKENGVTNSFRWPNELVPVYDSNGDNRAYCSGNEGNTFQKWVDGKSSNKSGWFKLPNISKTTGF